MADLKRPQEGDVCRLKSDDTVITHILGVVTIHQYGLQRLLKGKSRRDIHFKHVGSSVIQVRRESDFMQKYRPRRMDNTYTFPVLCEKLKDEN